MKISEIVQRIQARYSKGVPSDDSRLTSRHIYNKMVSVRTVLITQRLKKKQRISPWNYQTLPCVELETVPASECPCVAPVGCSIVRSKFPLPRPLAGLSDYAIQSVTTIERSVKIDSITLNAVNSLKGNKYSAKKTNYFILNGYLYLTTYDVIGVVSVVGLFEDPIEAILFEGYCTTTPICIDYPSVEFIIDTDLIDTLVELASEELIGNFSRSKEDNSNNSEDNSVGQPR